MIAALGATFSHSQELLFVIEEIGKADRDPKVIWHEESGHYVMVLYMDSPNTYHIFRSKDRQTWEKTQVGGPVASLYSSSDG